VSQTIKNVDINLSIGYVNETISTLLQRNFLVCKLIITSPDNNISSVCIHRFSSACFAMVAVTGLMTTDTLYFHFIMSF